MKIIFMGTPDFSVGTLEALIEAGHEVCLVVTQPDKPKGRGKEMQPTPVKAAAMKHGIPVYQPKKIRDPECVEELRKYQADVMVVIAFGQILPKSILEMTPFNPSIEDLAISRPALPAFETLSINAFMKPTPAKLPIP